MNPLRECGLAGQIRRASGAYLPSGPAAWPAPFATIVGWAHRVPLDVKEGEMTPPPGDLNCICTVARRLVREAAEAASKERQKSLLLIK
jgi:hypothetical protein